nr:serine hydrolase domain-containing protein [Thermotogota bacterium]
LNFDDPVSDYLDDHLLENLFVYKGKDYKDQVTIHHLLSHTSGVADYFEDKAIDTENMKMLILKEKDRIWKPEDLIHFTQNHQKAVSRPGERYHYSDTGYILLGLLVERISGCSFATMLHEKIFSPLQMKDSYLMFYSQPESGNNLLNDIWFAGHEISNWNSLSIDWAGGGIVSTLDDLKVFIRALNHYEIISEKTLKEMYVFKHKFVTGLYYGLGFMEYRFRDYSPTLGFLPSLRGHMGVLGTQVFYDKNSDTTVIMNLGSTDYTSKSVRLLIQILANVFRISVNSSLTAEDSE